MIRFLILVKARWVSITLSMLALITVLSLWPSDELSSANQMDKIQHLAAYASLALPVALRKPERWKWLVLFFIAYSGAIEVLQPYVNRHGEWMDMLANAAGIACGLLAAEAANFLLKGRAAGDDALR